MQTKLIITLILAVIGLNMTAQTKPEVLTNETITTLVKKGLGSNIIINKIKTSKTNFDVSTDGLIKLKENKVPDDVVAVMVEFAGDKGNSVGDPNNPLSNHNSGIYYYNPNDSLNRLTRLDPTVVSSSKSGGFGTAMAQRFTYGLANNNQTSMVSGSNARKQLHDNTLVFYFYFEKNKSNLNNSASSSWWWFISASSPNEFALVKLTEKKDSRELITGQSNGYGHSTGVNEKQKVSFDYQEVAEGIFKVTLRSDVPQGEYCFMYTGAVPSMYNNDKVFDFGIY